jgi:hypothetical protein
MSFEKITVENINVPGHTENVRADKYQDMRVALLKIMPADAPGLPFSEIKEATKPHLSPDLFP